MKRGRGRKRIKGKRDKHGRRGGAIQIGREETEEEGKGEEKRNKGGEWKGGKRKREGEKGGEVWELSRHMENLCDNNWKNKNKNPYPGTERKGEAIWDKTAEVSRGKI